MEANLESVLNNVNKFINIDVHRQKYAEHFSHLRNIIFKNLRINEVFSYIFNGFQLEGSYGDNVKVSIPNEFDLVFHIKFPEQSLITVIKDDACPGNVLLDFTNVLAKIAKEKQHANNMKHLRQWLDKKNFLTIHKFQLFIQSCFIDVLSKLQYQITLDGKTFSLSYKRQGPAHTIYVHGPLDFDYSVDFVPGILLNCNQGVIENLENQWEAIPKPNQRNTHSNTSFRISYYRQEQNIIKDKKQLKNVYRMLKKFRDTKTNMKKMKSYYIKTLFLYKASRENSKYWTKSLAEIVIDMFEDLEESLRRKNLPFFWDQNLNLYDLYSANLLNEMLSCVESARKVLKRAANQLTIPLQKRVYTIFLDANERNLLENQNNSTSPMENEAPINMTNSFNSKLTTNEVPTNEDCVATDAYSREKSNSWECVIC